MAAEPAALRLLCIVPQMHVQHGGHGNVAGDRMSCPVASLSRINRQQPPGERRSREYPYIRYDSANMRAVERMWSNGNGANGACAT